MKIKQIFTVLLLNFAAVSAFALPAPFEATYAVSKSGMTLGEMNVSLSYTGNTYRYFKTSKATGLASFLSGDKVVENVVGKFQGNYLQPTNYLYHHTSKRKDRKDQFQFIKPTQVAGAYRDKTYNLQVPKESIDRASLELALARDVAIKNKDLKYSLVERGKQKDYSIKRLGQEKLTVSGKEYLAEKLIIERASSERTTTFWLAKDIDYLPIKIDHVEKGDPVVTLLKSFTKK